MRDEMKITFLADDAGLTHIVEEVRANRYPVCQAFWTYSRANPTEMLPWWKVPLQFNHLDALRTVPTCLHCLLDRVDA